MKLEVPSDYARLYFDGYAAEFPHPPMQATGTEGRCELCGETRDDAQIHQKPWKRIWAVPDDAPAQDEYDRVQAEIRVLVNEAKKLGPQLTGIHDKPKPVPATPKCCYKHAYVLGYDDGSFCAGALPKLKADG